MKSFYYLNLKLLVEKSNSIDELNQYIKEWKKDIFNRPEAYQPFIE
jgi:hypothetical protein